MIVLTKYVNFGPVFWAYQLLTLMFAIVSFMSGLSYSISTFHITFAWKPFWGFFLKIKLSYIVEIFDQRATRRDLAPI